MRLIDAKEIERQVKEAFKENPVVMGMLLRWIRKQPTIDAVEVVRCKDCNKSHLSNLMGDGWRFCMNNSQHHKDEHFCSYGERRGEG